MAERKRDDLSVNATTSATFGGVATAAAETVPGVTHRPARPVEGVDRDALRARVMAKYPNIRARLAE